MLIFGQRFGWEEQARASFGLVLEAGFSKGGGRKTNLKSIGFFVAVFVKETSVPFDEVFGPYKRVVEGFIGIEPGDRLLGDKPDKK